MRKDLYQELFEVENNHWWHNHKRKVIHQMIDKFAQRGMVLDIGAGTGKMLSELKTKGWEVMGIDREQEAVKWSKKRGVKVKLTDIEKKLPFKKNSFDLVLALDVLEHLNKDGKSLQEIGRVLKSEGVAIITVPAYQWLFNYWDKMLGHRRRYSKSLLRKIIKIGKFKIEFLSYFSMFTLFPSILVRLVKKLFIKTETSDFQTIPLSLISTPVIKLLNKIERLLLSCTSLPFGLSVI